MFVCFFVYFGTAATFSIRFFIGNADCSVAYGTMLSLPKSEAIRTALIKTGSIINRKTNNSKPSTVFPRNIKKEKRSSRLQSGAKKATATDNNKIFVFSSFYLTYTMVVGLDVDLNKNETKPRNNCLQKENHFRLIHG